MSGALSGIKVVELAAIGPVPFAAMILADMGAEIIRIDRLPAGDAAETSLPSSENRGRKSLSMDLKRQGSSEALLQVIESADVLLEGFRPGVMEKLGLGPDKCLARNPRLIYGRMTGWGQTGTLSRTAGHDINYIAITGALNAMGSPTRPPDPPLNLVGDYGGGAMLLLVGVLAALEERHRSGQGQVIDAAMSDGAALLMSPFYAMTAQGDWQDSRGANFLDGAAHYYGTYECSDKRFIALGAIEPQFYRALMQKLELDTAGLEDQTNPATWPDQRERLEAVFKTRTRAEWSVLLEGIDACFAPVLSMSEAPRHPHNVSRQTFIERAGVHVPAPAPRFSRTPSQLAEDAPQVGQHSQAILEAAGLPTGDIESLVGQGAVHVREKARRC